MGGEGLPLAARYYSQYRAFSRRQFAITLRLGGREMSGWSLEDAIAMERRHISEAKRESPAKRRSRGK